MLIIMLVLIPFGIFPSYVFQLIKMSKWQKKKKKSNSLQLTGVWTSKSICRMSTREIKSALKQLRRKQLIVLFFKDALRILPLQLLPGMTFTSVSVREEGGRVGLQESSGVRAATTVSALIPASLRTSNSLLRPVNTTQTLPAAN